MIDLDELKNELQAQLLHNSPHKSANDINAFIHASTKSVLGKLKRGFWFEIAFSIVCTIGLLYYALWGGSMWALKIYFGTLGGICIPMVVIIILLYRRIVQLGSTTLPVKANLISIRNILAEYTKRYLQITMLFLPLFLIFSASLGYIEGKNNSIPQLDKLVAQIPSVWLLITFFVLYIALVTWLTYIFTKWYLHKLYGQYIAELDTLIAELTETESP